MVKVELRGKLSPGVTGKDMIVALCGSFNDDEVPTVSKYLRPFPNQNPSKSAFRKHIWFRAPILASLILPQLLPSL